MSNQFLLIINKQDDEKFRQFKIRKFDDKYVWGIHQGIINNKIWNKIKKNDLIYFAVEEESFKIFGRVSKKIKKLNFGETIYPESIDKKQINYFLFFEKLDSCSISYHVLRNKSKSKIFVNEGIYEIKKEPITKKIEKIQIMKLPFEKTIGKAKRRRKEVEGFVRNIAKVKKLKKLYNDKCQINDCGFKLQYLTKNNRTSSYSEVHHYNPLKNESDDDWDNMIVLCPNHHAEFDFRVKFIHRDGITIIDKNGKEIGETIKFRKNHKLDMKNIESQLGE